MREGVELGDSEVWRYVWVRWVVPRPQGKLAHCVSKTELREKNGEGYFCFTLGGRVTENVLLFSLGRYLVGLLQGSSSLLTLVSSQFLRSHSVMSPSVRLARMK